MKKTILLIDDDRDIHLQTKILVEKAGYDFSSALSADEGVRVASESRPDLIIMDFLMPGKDGLHAYKDLSDVYREKNQEIPPVVMLTAASHSFEEKRSLLECGISAHLQKPFGPRELLEVFQNIFVTCQLQAKQNRLSQAIEENKNFLENLVESCPVLIITTDNEGNVTYINQAVYRLLGYAPTDITGKSLTDITRHFEHVQRELLRQENPIPSSASFECDIRRSDGVEVKMRCRHSQLRDKAGRLNGLLIVAEDISAEKQLQIERLEKERLTAITESFATINHKLNNPLTPILGNVQLLLNEQDSLTKNHQKRLETIEVNARKISKIVKDFGQISTPVVKRYYGEINTLEFTHEDMESQDEAFTDDC